MKPKKPKKFEESIKIQGYMKLKTFKDDKEDQVSTKPCWKLPTREAVAQPSGRQMGNCTFHLEICPLQFLLVSFCPLKFYFFRIVYLFLNQIVTVFFFFRLNHACTLCLCFLRKKKKRIASCILTVSLGEHEFGFIGKTLAMQRQSRIDQRKLFEAQ